MDPLEILRAFCQADGSGARLRPSTWAAVEPLVSWALEPAWDHLYLVHGYQIGTPQTEDGNTVVEVEYNLAQVIRTRGATAESRVEKRRYVLEPHGERSWRLRGPPPPPYVFASQADADALVALLSPDDSSYQSNSAFVWHLLRDAGFELPYADTTDLPKAYGLRAERTANIGDLAIFYGNGAPYHVGMVESDDGIVSMTLNGGLRRTAFSAFTGEVRYLRPASDADLVATPTPPQSPPRATEGAPTP